MTENKMTLRDEIAEALLPEIKRLMKRNGRLATQSAYKATAQFFANEAIDIFIKHIQSGEVVEDVSIEVHKHPSINFISEYDIQYIAKAIANTMKEE